MHPSLRQTAHRPWPLPTGAWCWRQSWLDLAFIHQRIPADHVQALLPQGLRLQTFDGSAWVGIVPFSMSKVGPRIMGRLPLLSAFPELNLRTYVEYQGKPGVWFFSLDAASRLIVFGGRHFYHLPYFAADMSQTWADGSMTFASSRKNASSPALFRARCRPSGDVFYARTGTFEHWATERYCLYSPAKHGGITRVEVHHAPWPLRYARLEMETCSLLAAAGLVALDDDLVCHFSSGVDVISFASEALVTRSLPD